MKKVLYSLVVFSILFIIGCKENSITDPVSVEEVNKDQMQKTKGNIPLNEILLIPGSLVSYLTLKGGIDYRERLIWTYSETGQAYYVELNLSINADLFEPDFPGSNKWKISSVSRDSFYVSEEGIYLLEKSFPVKERKDGLMLACRFLVTTDGIGLNAVWLSFPGVNDQQTNRQF